MLAVVTAAAAAWWPARTVARIPITVALSARPPRPRPAHCSALAAVLLAIGVASLAAGIDSVHDRANPLLVVAGTMAIVLAIPLGSPLAIRAAAAAAGRPSGSGWPCVTWPATRPVPGGPGRDQPRPGHPDCHRGRRHRRRAHRRRGQPVRPAVAVPDRRCRTARPGAAPGRAARLGSEVDRFAAALEQPAVVALQVAVNPADREGRNGQVLRPAARARPAGQRNHGARRRRPLYRHPEAAGQPRPEPGHGRPPRRRAHRPDRRVALRQPSGPGTPPTVQPIQVAAYTSAPTSLLTGDGLRRHGWQPWPPGWSRRAPCSPAPRSPGPARSPPTPA